jgi:hypothetical protein
MNRFKRIAIGFAACILAVLLVSCPPTPTGGTTWDSGTWDTSVWQ